MRSIQHACKELNLDTGLAKNFKHVPIDDAIVLDNVGTTKINRKIYLRQSLRTPFTEIVVFRPTYAPYYIGSCSNTDDCYCIIFVGAPLYN